VRLQFSSPRFGGERRHVGADGGQSFDVGVEDDGRDEAVGRAHRDAQVHHVVPGDSLSQRRGRRDVGSRGLGGERLLLAPLAVIRTMPHFFSSLL